MEFEKTLEINEKIFHFERSIKKFMRVLFHQFRDSLNQD